MPVRILFLGPLQDLVGCPEMQAEAPLDWSGLLDLVGPEMSAVLCEDRVNVACRGRVLAVKSDLLADHGDEIALLPPVSGG